LTVIINCDNAASSYLSLVELLGMFQGLGGVLASIASIVTIWLGSGPVQTGFSYFLIALVVTLGSFLIFFVVIRLVSSEIFTFFLVTC